MKLSIVATLYKSAPYIAEFHKRVCAAAETLAGEDYEIILVNDGSPNNSLDLAVQLAALDPRVVVIDLSRNFGHHKAIVRRANRPEHNEINRLPLFLLYKLKTS